MPLQQRDHTGNISRMPSILRGLHVGEIKQTANSTCFLLRLTSCSLRVEFGVRFPDMSRPYDREICEIARQVATKNQIRLQEGIYICLAGPSFETPADLRFLRSIGVDAVGMSTVPEVIVARHGGQRVLGISGISNKANLDGDTITTHEEVLEAGTVMVPKLKNLIRGVLREL